MGKGVRETYTPGHQKDAPTYYQSRHFPKNATGKTKGAERESVTPITPASGGR